MTLNHLTTLLTLTTLGPATASWASARPSARPAMQPSSGTAARPAIVPQAAKPGWSHLQSGLTYLGVGATTVGMGALASAAAGPGAAAVVAGSVALPLAISLGELTLLGGPRVAKIMGGKPADAQLAALVRDVALKAELPPPAHVFEIPTQEMNAFAAGMFARDRTVAVTSGLRAALTQRELQAVIAHEMGHLRHSDVARNMHLAAAAAGLGGLYQGGRVLLRASSSSSGGSKKKKDKDTDSGGSTVALGLGMMAAGLGAQAASHLIRLGLGRGAEFAADRVAAELYGPDAIVSALRKIETRGATAKRDRLGARGNAFAHLCIAPEPQAAAPRAPAPPGARKPWWHWQSWGRLLSTHPSMDERVEALQALDTRRV